MPTYYNNGSGVAQTVAGDLTVTDTLTVSSGGEIDIYNTADQTTNYERLRAYWTSNVAAVQSQQGGTGSTRRLAVLAPDGSGVYVAVNGVTALAGSSGGAHFLQTESDTIALVVSGRVTTGTVANVILSNQSGSAFSASSGTQKHVQIQAVRGQSGTAAFTALEIAMSGTGGSGTQKLIDAQIGGVSKFEIRAAPSSGTTGMYLVYHNGSAEVTQQVTLGAADSGGSGFKVLRVPN